MTELGRELLALRGIDPDAVDLEKLMSFEARMVGVADEMSKYLHGKYPNVAFHVDNAVPRDYDQAYDRFLLHAGEDDARITVHAYELEDGVLFRDDYYCRIKTADYEDWLERRFGDIASGLRVFATLWCMLGAAYTADYPVEQAADDACFLAYTWLLIPPSAEPFDRIAEAFQARVREMGLSGEFTLYRLAEPLARDATKEDVFRLFKSRDADNPVYSDSLRVTQPGADRGE